MPRIYPAAGYGFLIGMTVPGVPDISIAAGAFISASRHCWERSDAIGRFAHEARRISSNGALRTIHGYSMMTIGLKVNEGKALCSMRVARAGLWCILSTFLGISLNASPARCQEFGESQLKAAYLYRVSQFVEWPADAFKNSSDPIVGCILGDGPFSSELEKSISDKLVDARRIAVRHISDARKIRGCHILYISSLEQKRWPAIVDDVKGIVLLTIGETDHFAADGGVMSFRLKNDKIQIEVNMNAAERERLHISSRLLRLSTIIKK